MLATEGCIYLVSYDTKSRGIKFLKVEKLKENFNPSANNIVSVKRMGNITEIRSMAREPKATIKKLNKETYVDLSTRRN